MRHSNVVRFVIALCYLAGLILAWNHGRSRARSPKETEISIHAATQQFGPEVLVTEATPELESSEPAKKALIEALIKEVESWFDSGTVQDWVKVDPLEAVSYFENNANAGPFMGKIMSTWGKQAPLEASSWLALRSSVAYFETAAVGLAIGVAEHDPEGAIAWTQHISDSGSRFSAFTRVGNELFRQDPQLAEKYLEESGFSKERQAATLKMWELLREDRLRRLTGLLSTYVELVDDPKGTLDLSSKENFVRQAVEAIPDLFSFESNPPDENSTIIELEVEALLKRVKLEGRELTFLESPE